MHENIVDFILTGIYDCTKWISVCVCVCVRACVITDCL